MTSFLWAADIVYMNCIVIIRLSADKHLGCFHFPAIVNGA